MDPRKAAPVPTRKAYAAIVLGKHKDGIHATIPQLLAAVKRFKPTCEPRYIPHPATWLNSGDWLSLVPTDPDADAKTAQAHADFEAALEQLRAEEDAGHGRQ